MGNVIMKAQQITYGASNVEKALDDLKAPELIELNKRMDAIDAWKANVHEETYTGSELTIENALALPARSLITSINAIQDLHGYDHPWAGGAGKNKCNIADAEIGTAWNGASNADRARLVIPCKASTQYTISINGTNSLDNVYVNDSATVPATGSGDVFTTSKTFTTGASSAYIIVGFNKTNIAQADVDALLLQLELGGTATSFAPYSNICPISGRTEARVDDTGANLANKSTISTDASGAIITSAGTIFTAVEANKSYILSFNLKEKMSTSSLQNRRLSLYLNDSVSLYQWTNTDTIGKQRITITPTASGYLNLWAGADVFSANTEVIDDIYLTDAHSSATIQLGQTVYGADINWDTGVMTVNELTHIFTGEETIEISSDRFSYAQEEAAPTSDNYNCISSHYKKETNTNIYNNRNTAGYTGICAYASRVMWVDNVNFASKDVTAYKTYLASQYAAGTPFTITYKLATPQTLQLAPTQLEMLKGYNRITVASGYATIELKALVLGGDN